MKWAPWCHLHEIWSRWPADSTRGSPSVLVLLYVLVMDRLASTNTRVKPMCTWYRNNLGRGWAEAAGGLWLKWLQTNNPGVGGDQSVQFKHQMTRQRNAKWWCWMGRLQGLWSSWIHLVTFCMHWVVLFVKLSNVNQLEWVNPAYLRPSFSFGKS